MPKWWPFSKSQPAQESSYRDEEEAYRQAVAELQQQIGSKLQAGTSKQAVLKTVQAEAEALAQVTPTSEAKGRLRALDELYEGLRNELMGNLQNGRALEMAGRVDEAIPYYETAVADQMSTRFPYEHLRIIYRRRGQPADGLRVCETAVANPFLNAADHAHFQKWADRFAQELQTES